MRWPSQRKPPVSSTTRFKYLLLVPPRGMKVKKSISLDEELLEQLDQDRGIVPRSTWINDLLRKAVRQE